MEGPIQDPSPPPLDRALHGDFRAAPGRGLLAHQPVQPCPRGSLSEQVLISVSSFLVHSLRGPSPAMLIELCMFDEHVSLRLEAVPCLAGGRVMSPAGVPGCPDLSLSSLARKLQPPDFRGTPRRRPAAAPAPGGERARPA